MPADLDSTKVCENCHVPFKGRYYHDKKGERHPPRFCSRSCHYASFETGLVALKCCSRCKATKSLSDFDRHRYSRDGYKSECKLCRKAYNHRKYHAVKHTPKQKRINLRVHLKARYGLTIEQFEGLAAAQGGRCAICRKLPPKGKRLHIDHCHETNRIRGLLCIHCNRALGSLGDNPEGVMRAVRYLQCQLDLLPECPNGVRDCSGRDRKTLERHRVVS